MYINPKVSRHNTNSKKGQKRFESLLKAYCQIYPKSLKSLKRVFTQMSNFFDNIFAKYQCK